MIQTLPALNALWRPNAVGPAPLDRDDREVIRRLTKAPVAFDSLTTITVRMNTVAGLSPAAVAQVQAWMEELLDLEEQSASQVADGTAHLGNVKSYEGVRPGLSLDRADLLNKAGELEWDLASWSQQKVETVDGPAGTQSGMISGRVAGLRTAILDALGIKDGGAPFGQFAVSRS